jgi:hypothetical protein
VRIECLGGFLLSSRNVQMRIFRLRGMYYHVRVPLLQQDNSPQMGDTGQRFPPFLPFILFVFFRIVRLYVLPNAEIVIVSRVSCGLVCTQKIKPCFYGFSLIYHWFAKDSNTFCICCA